MNKYIVTLIDNKRGDTEDHEIEAETAQDALTIAEFNICKGVDFHGKPIQRIYEIKAKG